MKASLAMIAVLGLSGCGLLTDALSNASETDFDVKMMKPNEFGNDPSLEVQPLSMDVNVSESSPSFGLPPSADTKKWGPTIKAHAMAVEEGQDPIFVMDVTNFIITSTVPIYFDVDVFSRDGVILDPQSESIVKPASCGFALPTTATGADFATHMTACFVDWVTTNGVPQVFDYLATTSDGTGKQAVTYSTSHSQTMYTEKKTEVGCAGDFTDQLPDDLIDNADQIKFEKLSLGGVGASTANVVLYGFGAIVGANHKIASARIFQPIFAGQLYWLNAEYRPAGTDLSGFTIQGNSLVRFSPAMPKWLTVAMNAAAGVGAGGAPGFGGACWIVSGDAPRAGVIAVNLTGTGKVDLSK